MISIYTQNVPSSFHSSNAHFQVNWKSLFSLFEVFIKNYLFKTCWAILNSYEFSFFIAFPVVVDSRWQRHLVGCPLALKIKNWIHHIKESKTSSPLEKIWKNWDKTWQCWTWHIMQSLRFRIILPFCVPIWKDSIWPTIKSKLSQVIWDHWKNWNIWIWPSMKSKFCQSLLVIWFA